MPSLRSHKMRAGPSRTSTPDPNTTNLRMRNFVRNQDGQGEYILVHGKEDDLADLSAYVDQNYNYQALDFNDKLCALHALEISLRPICAGLGLSVPTKGTLLDAFLTSKDYKSASRRFSDAALDVHKYGNPRRDRRREGFLSENSIRVILYLMSKRYSVLFNLGVVQAREDGINFDLKVHEPLTDDPNKKMSNTQTVWLINNGLSQNEGLGWAGFGLEDSRVSSLDSTSSSEILVQRAPESQKLQLPTGQKRRSEGEILVPTKKAKIASPETTPPSPPRRESRPAGIRRSNRRAAKAPIRYDYQDDEDSDEDSAEEPPSPADSEYEDNTQEHGPPSMRHGLNAAADQVSDFDESDEDAEDEDEEIHARLAQKLRGRVARTRSAAHGDDEYKLSRGAPNDINLMLRSPRAQMQPPWSEMTDITIEELILWFPNHVMNWPGIALLVSSHGWDQAHVQGFIWHHLVEPLKTKQALITNTVGSKMARTIRKIRGYEDYSFTERKRYNDSVQTTHCKYFYRPPNEWRLERAELWECMLRVNSLSDQFIIPSFLQQRPFTRRLINAWLVHHGRAPLYANVPQPPPRTPPGQPHRMFFSPEIDHEFDVDLGIKYIEVKDYSKPWETGLDSDDDKLPLFVNGKIPVDTPRKDIIRKWPHLMLGDTFLYVHAQFSHKDIVDILREENPTWLALFAKGAKNMKELIHKAEASLRKRKQMAIEALARTADAKTSGKPRNDTIARIHEAFEKYKKEAGQKTRGVKKRPSRDEQVRSEPTNKSKMGKTRHSRKEALELYSEPSSPLGESFPPDVHKPSNYRPFAPGGGRVRGFGGPVNGFRPAAPIANMIPIQNSYTFGRQPNPLYLPNTPYAPPALPNDTWPYHMGPYNDGQDYSFLGDLGVGPSAEAPQSFFDANISPSFMMRSNSRANSGPFPFVNQSFDSGLFAIPRGSASSTGPSAPQPETGFDHPAIDPLLFGPGMQPQPSPLSAMEPTLPGPSPPTSFSRGTGQAAHQVRHVSTTTNDNPLTCTADSRASHASHASPRRDSSEPQPRICSEDLAFLKDQSEKLGMAYGHEEEIDDEFMATLMDFDGDQNEFGVGNEWNPLAAVPGSNVANGDNTRGEREGSFEE